MTSDLGIAPYYNRRKSLANSALAERSQTVSESGPTTSPAVFFIHEIDQSPITPDNILATNNPNNKIPPWTPVKVLPTISSVPAKKSIL
jgi:hypothetical protein